MRFNPHQHATLSPEFIELRQLAWQKIGKFQDRITAGTLTPEDKEEIIKGMHEILDEHPLQHQGRPVISVRFNGNKLELIQ